MHVEPPHDPNPLSPQERQELEQIQKIISRNGATTDVPILLRFAELRKKHADYFFEKQDKDRMARKVEKITNEG